jgi:TolA-binding protein
MKRLLFLGLVIPAVLFGQKNEIIALQRDVASLEEQVRTLQKSQDEKLAAIQALLQQAVDASSRVSSSITALQHEVDTKLNDQQGKLVTPVATLGVKVDQVSDESRAVANNVVDLRNKINALDGKLTDISNAIRTLNTPSPAAPAPAAQVPAAADPCAGMSAASLWESARHDKSAGHLDLAMTDYANYVKCFGDTANAPVAQFEIGMLYFNGSQYDDAAKAFDDVVERFPENQKTDDALYYKAVSMYRADHRTEAGKVFKDYVNKYPRGQHIADAHKNLRNLAMEPAPRKH